MNALIGLGAAAALLASVSSLACTPDEASVKARQLAAKIHALTGNDPRKAAALSEEMHYLVLRKVDDTLPNECTAYDQRMEQMEQAAGMIGRNWDANY